MPIIIKDYTWAQTENNITITIPFRTIEPYKADVFLSSKYLKVTLNQLFWDVLLTHPIDRTSSKCIKTQNSVIFELRKNDETLWETLEPNVPRLEKNTMKQEAILEEHERYQKECQERDSKKSELKKLAVREQIEAETKDRESIENVRKTEEKIALGDVDRWQKKIRKTVKNEETKRDTPKPRSSKSLQILFTPREFPTPSRESYLDQETEFLRKQAEARRSAGFISEDIRPEERNPQFLLAKGRDFLKKGNYLGAISALSFGIKLSENFVDLYIARSEAHMCLENYNRATKDCTKALELLKPATPINLEQRALCIGRRGLALCSLNMLKHGISELEASLKLMSNDYFQEKLVEAVDNYTAQTK